MKSRFSVSGLVIFVFSVFAVSACSSSTSIQKRSKSASDPISVSDSRSVSFYEISFQLESGKTLGNHHKGLARVEYEEHKWVRRDISIDGNFKDMANDILSRYGYNVLSGGESVFGKDRTSKSKYQIGGEVYDIKYNTYGDLAGGFAEVKMWVDWKIYDTSLEKVVHKASTNGYYRGKTPLFAMRGSFKKSFKEVLSEGEFVENIKDNKAVSENDNKKQIKISKKDRKINIPKNMSKINKSIITILVGKGHGTGFLIGKEGYAITANHVVSGMEKVDVRTSDGVTLSARVVRSSGRSDVSLLKVKGKNFDVLEINTDRHGIGKSVYAVGTPLERSLSNTVTKGVISQYRAFDDVRFVQTDASVNSGNSGGPLLNSEGEVVGIVSWKYSGDNEGVSFAVTTAEAVRELNLKLVR